MKKLITLMFLLSLSACHSSAEIEGDGYRIKTDTGYPYGTHRHCPPGHAKKGWC